MTTIEHLGVIESDIEKLIEYQIDFNAFIIICLGIEFLGSFSDDKPFNKKGQSEKRFKMGLKYFKNNWYKQNKKILYEDFRGYLIHQYRPSSELYLTSTCKHGIPAENHLKISNSKRIIVLEALFEDFKQAIQKFKNVIEKPNSLNKKKLEQNYTRIGPIKSPIDNNNYEMTGGTSNNISELSK